MTESTVMTRIYLSDHVRLKKSTDRHNKSGGARLSAADSIRLIFDKCSRQDQLVMFYELEIARLRKVINSLKSGCIQK